MEIKKIIQVADIHIRNLKRHEEYLEQLNKFIDKCKEITKPYKKDEVRILICGDIIHSKNQISNELIVFTSSFLRKLEKVAKVLIYSGNHDLLQNNSSRTDTLTALFETAQFKNCKYLDEMLGYESGCIVDNNIIWALYSIHDGYSKPSMDEIDTDGKHIIGLYHGVAVGSTLPNGYVSENGLGKNAFDICEVVMAGDIHKRQEIKFGDTRLVYPGSLIQQNFGETVSQHGFAVWNVEDMSYEFVDLESDWGLYDIWANSIDDIKNDTERLKNF